MVAERGADISTPMVWPHVKSMKVIRSTDAELEPYKETLAPYVGGYNARGVAYWVFIEEGTVVGLTIVDKEPVRLLEPVGTMMSLVLVIDYDQPIDILKDLAEGALEIARDQGAAYSFVDVPAQHNAFVETLCSLGYKQVSHSLRMERNTAERVQGVVSLDFEKVRREDVLRFLDNMTTFMSGSGDNMLDAVTPNVKGLPEEFLDHWYAGEILLNVFQDEEHVGILNLSLGKYLNIANLGVAPAHRAKGFGRQVMVYAVNTLIDQGETRQALRVHAENSRAIHLYESIGFERRNSYRALIWRE